MFEQFSPYHKTRCLLCRQKPIVSLVEPYCTECLIKILPRKLKHLRCRRDTIEWVIATLTKIFLERLKLQNLFSELIGHIVGDGSFELFDYYDEKYHMKRRYYSVRYTPGLDKAEDARHFANLHKSLFGFEPKIYPRAKNIEVCSRHRVGHIIHCFLPPGRKTVTNPRIPPFIYNSDDNMIGFLKAVFKDEGYLYQYEGTEDLNLEIDMNTSVPERIKEEVATLLNVDCHKNTKDMSYIYKHNLPIKLIKKIETRSRCNVLDDISRILMHLEIDHTLRFERININKNSITATWILSIGQKDGIRRLQRLGVINLNEMKVNVVKYPSSKMGIRRPGMKIPGDRVPTSKDIIDLFEKARDKVKSWKNVAIALKVHPKMVYRYRKGTSSVPVIVYNELKRLATM